MGGTWCSWIEDVLMGGARVMRNSMDQMRTFIYNHVVVGKWYTLSLWVKVFSLSFARFSKRCLEHRAPHYSLASCGMCLCTVLDQLRAFIAMETCSFWLHPISRGAILPQGLKNIYVAPRVKGKGPGFNQSFSWFLLCVLFFSQMLFQGIKW